MGLFFGVYLFGIAIADQPVQLAFRIVRKYVNLALNQKHG
jgi:hypothetical protein